MRRPIRPLSMRRLSRAQISGEQLASLSHEFRTPLNGVLGMTRLLEGTKLTAEQRAYAVALRESGQHLLALVNDVLDFAKLGAGRVELHAAPFDVENLLRGVCELLAPRAREKGLEIAWAAPAGMGRIYADEHRLRQILLNFAGNAIKFTDRGGVLISISPPAHGRLRFQVEDTGPGVSECDRDRIFEAFAQAGSGQQDLGGAGLGLAIARRLARAMDGEVGVRRARLGGACFWFEAPLAVQAAAQIPGVLAGLSVGVASPSPIIREAARRQIQACGGRGVAAAELPVLTDRGEHLDAILIDYSLYAVGDLPTPPGGAPAILLLDAEERAAIPRSRKAGYAGYLIKPLRRASLAERVLVAAGASAGRTRPPEDDRVAKAAARGVRVLLVEDNSINALLARALLTREGCTVDHVQGGEEALTAVQVGVYDLILMDMRMPGMSGEACARTLRDRGVTTPIVALTANAFDDDRRACMAAGMDDFLIKPLSPDALRMALLIWTRGWTESAQRAKVG